MIITDELIESLKTNNGGFTKKTLKTLGVSWPPRRGWKRAIIGKEVPDVEIPVLKAGD